MVWTCHEERPRICKMKDYGNGATGKEEKRETKEKIFRCGERGYGGDWSVEGRMVWRKIIRCDYP